MGEEGLLASLSQFACQLTRRSDVGQVVLSVIQNIYRTLCQESAFKIWHME